jgi:predicted nucleic-acid-binding protein
MLALDTNVLVRLFARDEPKQIRMAERVVEKGGWVGHIVLVEAVWVLDVSFGFSKARIIQTLEELLKQRDLVIQDSDSVEAALSVYRATKGVEFADCLILAVARKNGHGPVGTFDRAFAKLDGVDLIGS